MNSLAVDGVRDGFRTNAISPVAAARILQRSDNGACTPEQVAPGVAYLASRTCDLNRVILHAANGHFSVMNIKASEALELSGEDLTPEAVGVWFDEATAP